MPNLNALDVDDAMMKGGAQADEWLKEIEQNYAAPVKEAQVAMLWQQVLARLAPGMPPSMVEAQLQAADPAAYEAIKKRFMEGMINGAK